MRGYDHWAGRNGLKVNTRENNCPMILSRKSKIPDLIHRMCQSQYQALACLTFNGASQFAYNIIVFPRSR